MIYRSMYDVFTTGLCSLLFILCCQAVLFGDPPSPDPAKGEVRIPIPPGARYIDYEEGSDANPGTRARPWRHHPWDPNATGTAAAAKGVTAYVFKRGVQYRGALLAKESGEPGRSILLASDPSWGAGPAGLFGSERVAAEWRKCAPGMERRIPAESLAKTWYVDLDLRAVPHAIYQLGPDGGSIIPKARTPNWTITNPDNPREHWWEFTKVIYTVRVDVESSEGFQPGQKLKAQGWGRHDEAYVKEVGKNWLKLEVPCSGRRLGSSRRWRTGRWIGTGRIRTKITRVRMSARQIDTSLVDSVNLTDPDPQHYVGAMIWLEGDSMAHPMSHRVLSYNPQTHELTAKDAGWHFTKWGTYVRAHSRYYLEGLPAFLDEPGEWWYDKGKSRLFLRLPEDRNPNETTIELGQRIVALNVHDRKHILIRGLEIAYLNSQETTATGWTFQYQQYYLAGVRITGLSGDITVTNCHIHHVPHAVTVFPSHDDQLLEDMRVERCSIHDIEDSGIYVYANDYWNRSRLPKGLEQKLTDSGGYPVPADLLTEQYKVMRGRVRRVKIIGNQLRNVGYRSPSPSGGPGGCGIALWGTELVEVAYNDLNVIYGIGIELFAAPDPKKTGLDVPLNRNLIHHNTIDTTMLATTDYGGLEAWRSPMTYIYCNNSGNAVGLEYPIYKDLGPDGKLKSHSGSGIYLDHGIKCYVFNNIVWGKHSDGDAMIANPSGMNQACGILTIYFNNTIFHTVGGFTKWATGNRCCYLNNLLLDQSSEFIMQRTGSREKAMEPTNTAFARNVFFGTPKLFAHFGPTKSTERTDLLDIDSFAKYLAAGKFRVADAGIICKRYPVVDVEKHDFRPVKGSPLIDRAAKVFVPWGLYRPVGEWHFILNPSDPSFVIGEHFDSSKDMDDYWKGTPRNSLTGRGIEAGNFTAGILESWAPGAVVLNGADEYFELKDGLSIDVGENNFLVEAVVKGRKGSAGDIVAKGKSRGFALSVTRRGRLRLRLAFAGGTAARQSRSVIADGRWHHVLAEVDRKAPKGIAIYVDGRKSDGRWSGKTRIGGSLSNGEPLLVGRSPDGRCTAIALDFLRVCRGTLADAETTIEELYDWEFNGPFLRDFYGRKPAGKARDVGAIEYSR